MNEIEKAIEMLKSKMDGNTDTSYEWCATVRIAIQALREMQERQWVKFETEIDDGKEVLSCPIPDDEQEDRK